MDKITRKGLKTDKFAVEVEHTVEYVAGHRKQIGLYAAAALAVVAIAVGVWWYLRSQEKTRQQELSKAIQVTEAPIGAVSPGGEPTYPTAEAKQAEAAKQFTAILAKHSGSDEAAIAASYLGALNADQGKLGEAEKYYKQVISEGNDNYASIGKLALAKIYFATNRAAEGEKLYRSLMDKPTVFVTKEQATIALARDLAPTKPADARKLLDPLKGGRQAVSQNALTALNELPAQ